MPERDDGAPFIARCTYQQPHRGGAWQCRLTDPHEGVDHDLPPDAEFGRDLDAADPLWLAAKLRDERARNKHLQGRLDEINAAWAMDPGPVKVDTLRAILDGPRG